MSRRRKSRAGVRLDKYHLIQNAQESLLGHKATQVQKTSQTSLLLESLGVSTWLALVRSLPGEVALEEGLVIGVVEDVQWGVLVALKVWGNVDDWLPVLAAADQNTGDD